eukprot:TRINITY_DN1421_c1_g1_i3.p1 TRINITY_DN1421_c1_g1~~TRINITY_DN1421_c1_g1_i3.p1  ORF type:complete len:1182 (-),score=152.51 TRINITY_DN1421_c1_g1_i3:696-4241(-)
MEQYAEHRKQLWDVIELKLWRSFKQLPYSYHPVVSFQQVTLQRNQSFQNKRSEQSRKYEQQQQVQRKFSKILRKQDRLSLNPRLQSFDEGLRLCECMEWCVMVGDLNRDPIIAVSRLNAVSYSLSKTSLLNYEKKDSFELQLFKLTLSSAILQARARESQEYSMQSRGSYPIAGCRSVVEGKFLQGAAQVAESIYTEEEVGYYGKFLLDHLCCVMWQCKGKRAFSYASVVGDVCKKVIRGGEAVHSQIGDLSTVITGLFISNVFNTVSALQQTTQMEKKQRDFLDQLCDNILSVSKKVWMPRDYERLSKQKQQTNAPEQSKQGTFLAFAKSSAEFDAFVKQLGTERNRREIITHYSSFKNSVSIKISKIDELVLNLSDLNVKSTIANLQALSAQQLWFVLLELVLELYDICMVPEQFAKLVKICSNVPSVPKEQIDRIASKVICDLDKFSSMEVLDMLKAFQDMKYTNPLLLDHVETWTTQRLNRLVPSKLVKILWMYARAGHCPKDLLKAILQVLGDNLTALNPQQLVEISWCCAKLGGPPSAVFLPKVVTALSVPEKLKLVSSKGLGALLWSCGRLNYLPSFEQLNAITSATYVIAFKFEVVPLVQTLQFMIRMSAVPRYLDEEVSEDQQRRLYKSRNLPGAFRSLTSQLLDRAYEMLDQFSLYNISELSLSISSMQYYDKDLMEVICEVCGNRVKDMEPQVLTNFFWALAKLNHLPPVELYQAVEDNVTRNIDQFGQEDLLNILWSFTRLRFQGGETYFMKYEVQDAMAKRFADRYWIQKFNDRQIASCLWSFAKIGFYQRYTVKVLLSKVFQSMQNVKRPMALGDLTLSFWAMAFFANQQKFYNVRFVQDMVQVLESRRIEGAEVRWIPMLLKAFAWARYSPKQLLSKFEKLLYSEISQIPDSQLSSSLWSFSYLNHRPDRLFTSVEQDSALCHRLVHDIQPQECIALFWSLAYFRRHNTKLGHTLYTHLMRPQMRDLVYNGPQLRYLFYAARLYELDTMGMLNTVPLGLVLRAAQTVRRYLEREHPMSEKSKTLMEVGQYACSLGFEVDADPQDELVDADLIFIGKATSFAVLLLRTESFLRNSGEFTGETDCRIRVLSGMGLNLILVSTSKFENVENEVVRQGKIVNQVNKGFNAALKRGLHVPELENVLLTHEEQRNGRRMYGEQRNAQLVDTY